MKRAKAINKIVRVLDGWQGCKLDRETAKEILNALESLGMKPPFSEEAHKKSGEVELIHGYAWDKRDDT